MSLAYGDHIWLVRYFMFIRFLDTLPAFPTILIGCALFLAPFSPEPHLVEKFNMVREGVVLAPIDIFDVLLHGSAGVLAISMIVRQIQLKYQNRTESDTSSED